MNSTAVVSICLVVLFTSNLILYWLYLRQQHFFKTFTKDISQKDLKTLLHSVSKSLAAVNIQGLGNQQAIKAITQANRTHFQKIGFVRFNPLSDTGGDQSFCLCLLDANDNGVVITSLHSREQTRMYAKTITAAQSEQQAFFEEEKQASALAVNPSISKTKISPNA